MAAESIHSLACAPHRRGDAGARPSTRIAVGPASGSSGARKSLKKQGYMRWCPGEDSNLHELLHWYLKPARLPVPPPGQDGCRTRGAEMYALPLCLSNKGAALWLG